MKHLIIYMVIGLIVFVSIQLIACYGGTGSGYSGYSTPTKTYRHSVVDKHGYTPYKITETGNRTRIFNYRTGNTVRCSTYGSSTYCY